MRFAARLLTLVLCFELIMGGYGPSIVMSSNVWAEEPCPAGTRKDETLNRCLTTNQVASIKMATARCNTGTKEEQQQCYMANAQTALDSEVGKNGVEKNNTNLGQKSQLLRVGSGAAIAVPLFLLTHQLFKKKEKKMACKPASLMLMYAGAGVLLGGEVFTYFAHKKRLKEMKSRWEKIATPTSGASTDSNKVQQTEAQSQAFGFLAENELSIAKTANTKFAYYAASAGLFAAGAVMAVVEKVKLVAANTAKKTALASGNTAGVYTAQKEIDRITCNVTKDAKKSKEEKEKSCTASGGKMSLKGDVASCDCSKAPGIKEGGEEGNCMPKTDEEKQVEADAKAKEEYDKLPQAKKDEIEKAKNAKIDAAKTKVNEAHTKNEAAGDAVTKAGKEYKALLDKEGNPLPGVDDRKLIDTKRAYDQSIKDYDATTTNLNNAKTNLTNIEKSTTGTPTAIPKTQTTTSPTTTNQNNSGGNGIIKTAAPALIQQAGKVLTGGSSNGNSGGTEPESTESKNQRKAACAFGNQESALSGKWDEKTSECKCGDRNYVSEDGTCIRGTDVESLRFLKLKRTAQYNLDQSMNAYELLELSKELENIEIENYSKITNYEDMDVSEFKIYTFGGFTNELLSKFDPIGSAHAMTCDEDNPCPGGAVCEASGSCGAAPASEAKMDTKMGVGEIIKAIFNNPFKKKGQEAKMVIDQMGDKVDKAIGKPLNRAAINGVFGTWIGIMSADFKEQANISKKRAEVLNNMKAEFESNSGITNCTDAERNSTSKPDCYCYTPEGQRNTARTNSAICQKLWGTFGAKAGNYLAESSKVCIDQNSNPDPSCSCRAKIGSDGKNSCLKANASSFNISGLSTGSFKMLNAGTSPASDLANGVIAPGQLDAGAAAANAMRIKNAADDMLKKSDPKAALEVKKLSDQIAASSLASTAGLSMGGGDSSGSMSNMSPAQAAKALEEELEKGTKQEINTAGSSESIGTGNATPEKLEFGMTTEDLAVQEDQIAEVMNKDLDMDQSDINKGSDTNLFEVLSNRYQRSGMRRLFDVNGKTEAEKPAETDINQ